MVPDSPAHDSGRRPPVYLVGDEGTSETLAAELAGGRDPVETLAPGREGRLDPPACGVVCLESRPADRSVSDVVAAIPAELDCPVVAAGTGVDARAAYEAGATEVVPLSPAERAALVADRVRETVDREGTAPTGPAGTGTDSELVDALSAAFPDYAFVYDEDGRYLDVMTGLRTEDRLYEEADLLGRTVDDLLDAETADRIVEAIGAALSTGDVQTVEYDVDRPAGRSRYRGRVAPLADRYEGRQAAVLVARDVTERKRQQERFQAFIEQSTDIITVLSPDGTYKYQSPAGERVIGYEPAELIGENAFEYIHPDDRGPTMETFAEAVENPELTPTVEYRFRAADGSWRWLESVGNNQLDNEAIEGFVVNSRDITERKQRERELERAERRFDAVFNAASALVTLLDTGGHIEEISDAAVTLVPESREEIRGRPLWEGPWFERDEDLQDRLREAVETALDGESARVETPVPVPGLELVIDAMFEPIVDDDGELRGVLGVARDVTERHRDQRIRRELLSATREMMSAGSREQLAAVVSQAASGVLGHDLNAVYLHGEDASLSPVAWSDRVEDLFGEPPEPTGAGPVSQAHRSGDPAIYDSIEGSTDRPAERYDPVDSLVALPLGEHGVLAVGAAETGAFSDVDVDRYRLLTVSAATAFDRLERTVDLQRYETLFETVQDRVYVLDEDGQIELVSDALAEAVGHDSDELVGEHVSRVVTDETAREVERLAFDLLVTPEEVSSTCEGVLVARDGTETPVEIELSVLPHEDSFRGTAGVVRDISERRQREEELRVFQRAITEAGIGLAMYGADGRFEYLNDHYADLLGQSRESLEGSPVSATFDGLAPGTFESHWESLDPGETEKRETEHVRGDGSTVPVETVVTAVEIDSSRHHIVTVQDITDRRERRQQTQALHRIFRHNLRNDLTVLFGHATILAEGLPGEFASNIETVAEKTENLIDLTETATEARSVLNHDTSREPVEAVGLIARRVAEMRSTHAATVETDLPDERYVWADSKLGVAVEHLLSNAVEHNDSASPRVWIRVFPAQDREDWVTIEVADNGPGLPEIERETLAAGREDQITHSVGLGLWIVRWIVSRYGGDLSFHDREPRGTRVRIALPRAEKAVAGRQTGGQA